MPRALTPEAVTQINAPTNDDPLIWLLTLRAGATVFRVCRNNEDITSRGEVYTAYPFDLVEPIDDGETLPSARLTIDNIDRLLVASVRSVSDPLKVDIELIMSTEPDSVQMSYPGLLLKRVRWDQKSLSGDLEYEPILGLAFPSESFYPQEYPGLF